MYGCGQCSKQFGSWPAARQHMTAIGHVWECQYCNNAYYDIEDLEQHEYEEGHNGPKYECEACDTWYDNYTHSKWHMNKENHWRTYWCIQCQRGFESENNLTAHLNSKVHRGTNILCPFCKRDFTTATGVTHHIESGDCRKARSLNRDTLLAEIRRRDPNNTITKRLLTFYESSDITATSASYNYLTEFYECYLCHREFGELKSLNAHVNSPAHKQNVYHCPGRACSKDFRTLAALFNHLESESCGAVRFDTVQRKVGGILSRKKLISFA